MHGQREITPFLSRRTTRQNGFFWKINRAALRDDLGRKRQASRCDKPAGSFATTSLRGPRACRDCRKSGREGRRAFDYDDAAKQREHLIWAFTHPFTRQFIDSSDFYWAPSKLGTRSITTGFWPSRTAGRSSKWGKAPGTRRAVVTCSSGEL